MAVMRNSCLLNTKGSLAACGPAVMHVRPCLPETADDVSYLGPAGHIPLANDNLM